MVIDPKKHRSPKRKVDLRARDKFRRRGVVDLARDMEATATANKRALAKPLTPEAETKLLQRSKSIMGERDGADLAMTPELSGPKFKGDEISRLIESVDKGKPISVEEMSLLMNVEHSLPKETRKKLNALDKHELEELEG